MTILTKSPAHELPHADPFQTKVPCRWAVVLRDEADQRHILMMQLTKLRSLEFAALMVAKFMAVIGPMERRAREIDAWLNEHAGEDGWTRLPPNKIGFADPAVAFEFRMRWM